MMNTVDLNRLRIFTTVVHFRSVREAARALNLTASAVSQSVKALEKETGLRLFQRVAQRMVPTPAAESLSLLTNEFTGNLTEQIRRQGEGQPVLSGHLKIGAPPVFGADRVTAVISGFGKYNRTRFSLIFGEADDLMARLMDGRIDLAFCAGEGGLEAYRKIATWKSVGSEERLLVCGKKFYQTHLAHDRSLKRLMGLPHVAATAEAADLMTWYRHHFKKIPPALEMKLIASDAHALHRAAVEGIGLAFLPVSLIEKDLQQGRLVAVRTGRPEYKVAVHLVQLKNRPTSRLQNLFVAGF